MKILTYILFGGILIGLVYVFSLFQEFSYFTLSKDYVEIGTMLLRPIDYNGGKVCTAGKYTTGEGVSELVDVENPTGVIWVATPVERSIASSLWQQYISKDPHKSSIARVCGVFEAAKSKTRGFGTNGQYQYQITSTY